MPSAGRAVRHLARVVHALHLRSRTGRGSGAARPGSRGWGTDSLRQRPDRGRPERCVSTTQRSCSARTARQPPSIGRFIWCRSASSSRCRSGSPSPRRSSSASCPFTPGDSVVMLPINGHPTSTAICYEVVFPSLMREAVLQGSQLLTTVTNDGWYGASSAPYQHFEMASMRAIEEGRYMARAANTGISGVVDPYGRIVQASAIFEQVGLVDRGAPADRPDDLLLRSVMWSPTWRWRSR